jgi:hypothetical protein
MWLSVPVIVIVMLELATLFILQVLKHTNLCALTVIMLEVSQKQWLVIVLLLVVTMVYALGLLELYITNMLKV